MVEFIDQNRDDYGVELICEQLPIAPSTYYAHLDVRKHPEKRSERARRDEFMSKEINRV